MSTQHNITSRTSKNLLSLETEPFNCSNTNRNGLQSVCFMEVWCWCFESSSSITGSNRSVVSRLSICLFYDFDFCGSGTEVDFAMCSVTIWFFLWLTTSTQSGRNSPIHHNQVRSVFGCFHYNFWHMQLSWIRIVATASNDLCMVLYHQVSYTGFDDGLTCWLLTWDRFAELNMEFLVCWRNHLPVSSFHRSRHGACKIGHRASVIPLSEKDLVGIVHEMVVRKCLEEFHRFHVMVMQSSCWFGLTRPVHGHIFSMALPERLPKRTSRSRIPSVIQRFH